MNLIDLYIHEVTRRLPERNREDIALELQSTIADMLPDDPTEVEVKQVLTQLGNPAVMASGYLDRPMHLIGPKYYDVYINLLKLVLPIAMTISLIIHIGTLIVSSSGTQTVATIVLGVFSQGFVQLLHTAMQTIFWITLVFAIIERTDKVADQMPVTMNFKTWTPDDLKQITPIPIKKRITKWHIFGSLLWTAIWVTVYFNASNLLGIYTNRGQELTFETPIFNQDVLQSYWLLIVLIIALEIALAIYKALKKQWTNKVAIFNTVTQIVALGILIVIFTNPNLWNDTFIIQFNEALSINKNVETWATQTSRITIAVVLIFTVIDIVDGFRKAHL
ncbi:HAAS signaling domain-containing protein [Paenisporosarcina quisquiliarum]|uniref:HAAS signaling domain-containing protein n=1 Tax=Paenisporosarcina quisquiliarum TaxID=365346 RepID=UPI003736EF1C